MSDRFPHASESVSAVLVMLVLMGVVGCGGGSSHSNFVTPQPGGPPAISSLSTTSGVFGASVQISGSNFGGKQGSSTVTFSGTDASIAKWSDSAIVAKVPSGASSGNVVVTVDGTASNAVNFNVVTLQTGTILPSNFGFQCGPGDTADCEGSGQGIVVWPTTQAQPGLLRLHDAGTQWANMDKGGGQYDFTELDQWLDKIADHQPVEVSQVFTWVPCWDAPSPCTAPPTAPAGTSTAPGDLGPGGSPSFNAFVTAFVQHCNSNNHCVKDYIRYYEMWNEWDLSFHWSSCGTTPTDCMVALYNMVAPAAAIIRSNVPNAVILTPSTTKYSDTGLGYLTDFQNWLNYETNTGRISDWVAWHAYLTNGDTMIFSPEEQWSNINANYLTAQTNIPNWATVPWANTETNFNGAPPPNGLNYTCPSSSSANPPTTFSPDDCTGMIVRWQLLHDSNGAAGVFWYKWNETIGGNQQYETAYYYMMQYLAGGKFAGPCTFVAGGGVSTWTCSFKEASGTQALWVWTPNEAGTSFSVPSGYVDYLDLTGNKTSVTSGQSITIGVMPIMLEQ
ncbi:MAG TPA: IPT/TIG domain-containing protein [Candidatus Sulfotelmatobacter sp.]|nr:IPT/TIG domain-containing protein [Candidatus Sulfotelmatobacter sp.]